MREDAVTLEELEASFKNNSELLEGLKIKLQKFEEMYKATDKEKDKKEIKKTIDYINTLIGTTESYQNILSDNIAILKKDGE